MDLGRSLGLVAAATVFVASGAVAQSPIASPAIATPAPSASPFPWPTIPRERLVPGAFPEWPSGRPTASTTDRDIRLDLWLSSTEAAPGEWVQAIVRATNVGQGMAWVRTGDECTHATETEVDIHLRPATPMGVEQTGNAAALKTHLVEGHLADHFRSPRFAYGRRTLGLRVQVFAECTNIRPRSLADPLAPGRTRTERFIWRAVEIVDERRAGRLRPLFPGPVPVKVSWSMGGRGAAPTQERLAGPGRPITVTTSLELTGAGPGTPSLPELVDTALADPDFRAWVDLDPERGWIAASASIPDVSNAYYAHYGRAAGILERAPNGYLQVVVERYRPARRAGVAFLDPWTGDLIDTWIGPAR